MIETLTLQQLESIVHQLPFVKNVKSNENSITFEYKDEDRDDILSLVTLINEEQATAMLLIPLSGSNIVSAMIACNLYNGREDVHGTFAYATNSGNDKFFIILESHINTRGGVSETNIRYQLRTFLKQINSFENITIEGIKEIGPDSYFLKDLGSGSSFWEDVGAFAGGFWKGYQR